MTTTNRGTDTPKRSEEEARERLEALERQIADLSSRVTRLEGVTVAPKITLEPQAASQPDDIRPEDEIDLELAMPDIARATGLVGRTLVVLGGAYLLRAITDAGILPATVGLALGFVYALSWLFWMGAAAGKSRPRSARFHGLAAALLVYPLVWEGAVRFEALGPVVVSLALGVVLAVTLSIGFRHGLDGVVWLHTAISTLTGLLLWSEIGGGEVMAVVFIGLTVAVVWLAERGGPAWRGLRWPTALVANGAVLVASSPEHPMAALALQATLVALVATSFGWLITREHRSVSWFEVVQTALVIGIGYGGAIAVAHANGRELEVAVGGVGLAIAAGAYAFPSLTFHRTIRKNFFFLTTVGLVFGVTGSGLLLVQPAWGWALLSLVVLGLGVRMNLVTLTLHGSLLAGAAAGAAGSWALGGYALVARGSDPWPELGAASLLVIAVAGIGALTPTPARLWGRASDLPQLVYLVTFIWAVAGVLLAGMRLGIPLVDGEPDPGILAAARTAVLAASAVGLALVARVPRTAVARALVVPVLVAAGFKLLAEDLPLGRPATLFAALALYGAALIVVPGLLRREATRGED